jgi:chromatin remodeling complex protein RSC6
VGIILLVYLFIGDDLNSTASSIKYAAAIGVAIMLIPKIALFYYCSFKLKEEHKLDPYKSSSSSFENPISHSDSKSKTSNYSSPESNKFIKSSRESTIINDEIFYEKALSEFESNRHKGLWIKILANNEGNEVKSKFEYIRIRAKDIQVEESAIKEQQEEQEKDRSLDEEINNFKNKKEASMESPNIILSIEFMPMKLPKNNGSDGSPKLVIPSVALSVVVGAAPLQRTEAMSKIWIYVKKHNLQDANNRRKIIADNNLRNIFGKSEVTMFEMAQLVNKHLK